MYQKFEQFTDNLNNNEENLILSFNDVDVNEEIIESEFDIDEGIKYGDYVTIDDFKKGKKPVNQEKKMKSTMKQIKKMLSDSKYVIVYVIIGLLLSIILGLILKVTKKIKTKNEFDAVEPPRLY
tara:strand:+ start:440 stop:811 length:372 start_codon:yes stop_codon:yes gene_type:complete